MGVFGKDQDPIRLAKTVDVSPGVGGTLSPNNVQVITPQTVVGAENLGYPQIIALAPNLIIDRGTLKHVQLGGNSTMNLTIASSTANYNVATAASDPGDPVTINLTVNPGVIVSSSNPANPALDIGFLPYGSVVNLFVNGAIEGAGGAGGTGGDPITVTPGTLSSLGKDGGPAIFADYSGITVYVYIGANGVVAGGGGGGGGGSGVGAGGAGGGGGGGAGAIVGAGGVATSPAQAGANGTETAGGLGGTTPNASSSAGGRGGNRGAPGRLTPAGPFGPGGSGGVPGPAVIGAQNVIFIASDSQVFGPLVTSGMLASKSNHPCCKTIIMAYDDAALDGQVVNGYNTHSFLSDHATSTNWSNTYLTTVYDTKGKPLAITRAPFGGVLATVLGNSMGQVPMNLSSARTDFYFAAVVDVLSDEFQFGFASNNLTTNPTCKVLVDITGGSQNVFTVSGSSVQVTGLPVISGQAVIAVAGKWNGTTLTLTVYINGSKFSATSAGFAGWTTLTSLVPQITMGFGDVVYGCVAAFFATGLPPDIDGAARFINSHWRNNNKVLPKTWTGLT